MSRQLIEVEIEPITGKKRDATRSQALLESMDEYMRRMLRAEAELNHRKNLRQRINGQPEPQHVLATPQPGSQFVQLEMWDLQGVEAALVQGLSVLACACELRGDGGLLVAEDPFGGGSVQPFGQRREHHCNLLRGGFQTIQRRVASSTERSAASLAPKRLDPLSMTMLAIANQGMHVSIGDAEVGALVIGTGVALGGHALGGSPPAFHLTPGAHSWRCWPYHRRGSGGETTGGNLAVCGA